jgi:hypothetical protein
MSGRNIGGVEVFGFAALLFVVPVLLRQWLSQRIDVPALGTMSEQWMAEYRGSHPS